MGILEGENKVRRADIERGDGDKFFVLADVHAFYKPMMRALEQNGFDESDPRHKIVLLGDMFDRGNAAVDTFDFFRRLGDRLTFVRGNHEDLFFRCLEAFYNGETPNYAHFLNGTVDTVMQFCDIRNFADYQWIYEAGDERRIEQLASRIRRATSKAAEFIEERSVDYATLDDYIFVHGYIPCVHIKAQDRYYPISDWQNGDWSAARWAHGTQAWHDGVRVDGKTIVCGHWHTSEAHWRFHSHGSEWENDADFSPFEDDGIIAMDACTSYSGKCNCIVL